MPYRLIHLSVPEKMGETVTDLIDKAGSHSWWRNKAESDSDNTVVFSIVLATPRTQEFLDSVADRIGHARDWHLVSNATEVVLPEIEDEDAQEKLDAENSQAAREEIYVDVSRGAVLSRDYLLMVALATRGRGHWAKHRSGGCCDRRNGDRAPAGADYRICLWHGAGQPEIAVDRCEEFRRWACGFAPRRWLARYDPPARP